MKSYWIALALVSLVIGIVPAKIARSKGKDFWIWYIYGVFLFLFAMIHAIVLPEKFSPKDEDENSIKTVKSSLSSVVDNITNEIGLIDINCPVEVVGYEIRINDKLGKTFCAVKLFNLSNKVVSSIKMIINCYDSFGQSVIEERQSYVEATIQDESAQPKAFLGLNKPILLSNHPNTRKVDIIITSVLFSDGLVWKKGDYELIEFKESRIPDTAELKNIQKVAGMDAICYPREDDNVWTCVCGRLNSKNDDNCKRCERNKFTIFERLSSRESIERELEKLEQAESENIKISNIKRKKKFAIICFCSIVIGIFLCFGYLTDFTFSYSQYVINYNTTVNSNEMLPLIGRKINDSEVQLLLKRLGNKKVVSKYDDCYFYCYRNKGIELRFESDDTFSYVNLFHNDEKYEDYKGLLPDNLTFNDNSKEVESKIGKPYKTEYTYVMYYKNYSFAYDKDFSSIVHFCLGTDKNKL
jgi:hypothetical protein